MEGVVGVEVWRGSFKLDGKDSSLRGAVGLIV